VDSKLEQIHREALQQFSDIENRDKDQRLLAIEDMKFNSAEDGQWDTEFYRKNDRPRFTINRVAGAVNQLIGDQRQNRIAINVRSINISDDALAETYTGLIRNIESNNATESYTSAFNEMVICGYGGWRILTEFDDDGFDQNIKIVPIQSACTSLWFEDISTYDRRHSNHAFYTVNMSIDKFKKQWPLAVVSDFTQDRYDSNSCQSWWNNNQIRVAEYWVKTPVNKEIALLSDGRIIDIDKAKEILDELQDQNITVIKTRTLKSHKIEMYLMTGAEILEGPTPWSGKFIPLVPVYGHQCVIEKSEYIRGLVRFSKDANRIYNYATSMAIETSALTPKDPIFITPTQVQGFESKYHNFNVENSPFLPYNPDPNAPGIPQRGGAPSVQTALLQQIQQASMDLYHVTGMQPPSIGINPELKSGKAIMSQEKLGDRGNYIFTDNLVKSISYTGDILVDLIPKIYDTERQLTILNEDDTTEMVLVNSEVFDMETGKNVIVNDLAKGKFTIHAKSGPAFSSLREESANQILELIKISPAFERVSLDLVAKNLGILESQELTKRIRKLMIQQGVVNPTDDEKQEFGLNEPQQLDSQQQAITDNVNVQTEKLIADIRNKEADTQSKLIKSYENYIESIDKLNKVEGDLVMSEAEILAQQQQQILEGN